MSLVNRTLDNLRRRREHIINGGINCIPSPFKRFSNDFVGIEQGKYYLISSGTKCGKTQFTSFTFIYNALHYAYNHPDQVRLKIFYYALEESPEDILERYMSFLLNNINKIRISTTDLKSTKADKPVDKDILNSLDEGEYKTFLKFFEEIIEFPSSKNPTGVYQDVKSFMHKNGTVHYKTKQYKDEFGILQETKGFDYYEPYDPNLYVLVVVDHGSLIQTECISGTKTMMSLKQSIDKLSEYFIELRNRYNVSPVLIQQQSFEVDSLDAYKENKLRSAPQTLSDSRFTARDCNCMLGLFNPAKHEIPEYRGYDIKRLKNYCRFLEVCLNRGNQVGGLIALFFDGATCTWQELPRPDDKVGMERVYKYIESLEKKKETPKTTFSFMAIGNKLKKMLK